MKNQSFLGQFKQDHYTITKTYLDSQVNQVRLYHTKFTPVQPIKTIAIIHGFGQHSGRFYQIAHFFAMERFQVLLIDLTGFGYSGGPRGCSTVQMLQNDVITLLTQAKPYLPLFLYAHSMGGLICIKLLQDRPTIKVSGCIFTGPLLGLPKGRHIPKAKLFFVRQLGDDLQDLIANSMINPTALTKNNKYMHNIFEDRLMIPFIGMKMAKSLFDAILETQKKFGQFSIPAIIFHGKKDSVVDYQCSRKFVYQKVRPYLQLKIFEQGYHELQHDVQKDQLLNQGLKFLSSLPLNMISPVGEIVYKNLSLKMKPKTHTIKKSVILLAIIGALIFLIKRYLKKK